MTSHTDDNRKARPSIPCGKSSKQVMQDLLKNKQNYLSYESTDVFFSFLDEPTGNKSIRFLDCKKSHSDNVIGQLVRSLELKSFKKDNKIKNKINLYSSLKA